MLVIITAGSSRTLQRPARSMSRLLDLRSLWSTPRACRYTIPQLASKARADRLDQAKRFAW
eukprot:7479473-Pyramimonas_sp.AAC.1